jgi:hypothetical protein
VIRDREVFARRRKIGDAPPRIVGGVVDVGGLKLASLGIESADEIDAIADGHGPRGGARLRQR